MYPTYRPTKREPDQEPSFINLGGLGRLNGQLVSESMNFVSLTYLALPARFLSACGSSFIPSLIISVIPPRVCETRTPLTEEVPLWGAVPPDTGDLRERENR